MSYTLVEKEFSLNPSCDDFSKFYSEICIDQLKDAAALCIQRLENFLFNPEAASCIFFDANPNFLFY